MIYVFYRLIMLHDEDKMTKEVWLRHGCSCLTAMATFQQLGQPSFVATRRKGLQLPGFFIHQVTPCVFSRFADRASQYNLNN